MNIQELPVNRGRRGNARPKQRPSFLFGKLDLKRRLSLSRLIDLDLDDDWLVESDRSIVERAGREGRLS